MYDEHRDDDDRDAGQCHRVWRLAHGPFKRHDKGWRDIAIAYHPGRANAQRRVLHDEETDDESLAEPGDEAEQAEAPDEPDWELIDKMANLSEPMEGVPDAPDLQELVIEEPPKSVEIEPQVLMQKEEFVNDEPDWPVKW